MLNEKKLLSHELLGYPRFTIYQRKDLFRFTIDSILLSSFVDVNSKVEHIIDLGCGNAVIPIYLTLKTNAQIYGIEIQEETYNLGLKSIKKNKLDAQIKLYNEDLKNAPSIFKDTKLDIVICNPPFFKFEKTSNVNKNSSLSIARHEVKITLEEIIKIGFQLLKDKGQLYLIHRPERIVDLISLLRQHNIEPKMIRFVHPTKGKNANHILVKAIKNGKPGSLKVKAPLYIYSKGNELTKEVQEIYNYGRDNNVIK